MSGICLKTKVLLGAACVGLLAAGCTTILDRPTPAAAMDTMEIEVSQEQKAADPAGAIDTIYGKLEEYSTEALDEEALEDRVGVTPAYVAEFYVRYSDPKSGLADIVIVKPYASKRDEVREQLYKYKDRRMQEFENYDILGAYTIAQNAVVFDQGDYVILLMLQDNDSAKTLIDGYITQ